jgi:UDP-2,3-diacylglucosamine pyrophosphatase LpxH
LKANTARALRRAPLTAGQEERIRKRVVEMLCAGHLPREYSQYAKLARRIGLGDWLSQVEQEADLNNVWVRHYYEYFKGHAAGGG